MPACIVLGETLSTNALLLLVTLLMTIAASAGEEHAASHEKQKTGKRWADMDYGPFLSASIEAPRPAGNIAMKGIAIRLGAGREGEGEGAVLFDTDLLRYSAGWTGGFVALKGVVYDGEHWAYPAISGNQVFANPSGPGWSKHGSFKDPRPLPFGPLPRAWAHWKGLYLNGARVILSYTVGDTPVLEMPGLEKAAGLTAFSRGFHIGPSSGEMALQVSFEEESAVSIIGIDDLEETSVEAAAELTIAVLKRRDHGNAFLTAAGVVGRATGSKWAEASDGNLRLRIPASPAARDFKVLVWRGTEGDLTRFRDLEKGWSLPTELEPLTRGGPPRWKEKIKTRGSLGQAAGPYAIDVIAWPDENPWDAWMRFGGMDFFADGKRAALTTWSGDVWIVSGIDEALQDLTWQRVATGLYQPLGLKIIGNDVYVLGRDQITRLVDSNGDGEADFYENFNNDHQTSEHFHEFAMDLETDPEGNFYYMKAGRHALDALHPQHGTLIKVSKDGSRSEILAKGFRAPNGILVAPGGELYSSDQQGFWCPANRINWIQPGGFYGNVWSYFPQGKPTAYDPPLCWIHPSVDRSPSTLLRVTSEKWGPLQEKLLSLSYGMGQIFLLLEERVNQRPQGAVVRFPLEFDTGIMRGRFHPIDGQLYVCGLFGWSSQKTRPGGFYRVRYRGGPLNMPSEFHAAADGVVLGFSDPLDEGRATDPGSYSVQVWNYRWSEQYGSPDLKLDGREGRDSLAVKSVAVSADRKRVFLRLPGLRPVMQIHIAMNIEAADGTPIRTFVHGTIHALGSRRGEEWIGSGGKAVAVVEEPQLESESPGLALSFVRGNAGPSDARPARLVALNVRDGTPPTPFLPPGPFHSTWEGYLKIDIHQARAFRAAGRGDASVTINGARVLDSSGEDLGATPGRTVNLKQGLNRIRVEYESPSSGDAVLRLFWSHDGSPWEPVPPAVLVHDREDKALQKSELLRRGRFLFATRRCIKCHMPKAPFGGGAMPELAADAPSLEEVGARLNEAWLVSWIEDPTSACPDAAMPGLIGEPGEPRTRKARDIAAFLSRTRRPGEVLDAGAEAIKAGEERFDALGCFACHVLPGDQALEEERRIPLAHLKAKWRPDALAEYLLEPAKRYAWTRMPDFRLSMEEARAIAGYLISRTSAPPGAREGALGDADAGRGRELVASLCVSCHPLRDVRNTASAPGLEALAGSSLGSGCLAGDADQRGKAPDFHLKGGEREALRVFLKEGLSSLDRTVWAEFAASQVEALRCTACHERDQEKDLWSALKPVDEKTLVEESTIHRMRPPLTWAGEKLRPEWAERFIAGKLSYKPRPRLAARMPAFPAYAHGLARGLALEHGLEAEARDAGPIDKDLATIGQALVQADGFICIQCHPAGPRSALAGPDTETINLNRIACRLRREHYERFLLNPEDLLSGTMMPRFTTDEGSSVLKAPFGGDARRQFEAIWNYLRTIEECE